jgi:hypothetical protein
MLPVTLLAMALATGACSDMTETQRRTATGAGVGAAGGAVIGSLTGSAGWGAVIGAGAGAASGYLYDQHKQGEQAAYQRGVQEGRGQTR